MEEYNRLIWLLKYRLIFCLRRKCHSKNIFLLIRFFAFFFFDPIFCDIDQGGPFDFRPLFFCKTATLNAFFLISTESFFLKLGPSSSHASNRLLRLAWVTVRDPISTELLGIPSTQFTKCAQMKTTEEIIWRTPNASSKRQWTKALARTITTNSSITSNRAQCPARTFVGEFSNCLWHRKQWLIIKLISGKYAVIISTTCLWIQLTLNFCLTTFSSHLILF